MTRAARTRNVGLVRVLSLLRLFQAKGRYRPDALAARFGVSVHTIYSDLDTLQQAGYPLTHEERHVGHGYWWMI